MFNEIYFPTASTSNVLEKRTKKARLSFVYSALAVPEIMPSLGQDFPGTPKEGTVNECHTDVKRFLRTYISYMN